MNFCVFFCFRMLAKSIRLLIVLCAVSVTFLALWYTSPEISHPLAGRIRYALRQVIPDVSEGFNNETGTGNGIYLVPNIIHFVRFEGNNFTFVDAVCVLSAFKNHHHSFSSLSYDRSKASSKASSPHSAIQSFLFQMRVSSPFLKVIQ